jgi:quinolinate synthase
MLNRLSKENPDKEFIPTCRHCDYPHMKINDLVKLLWSLEEMQYPITVPFSVAEKAKKAIDQMLLISTQNSR